MRFEITEVGDVTVVSFLDQKILDNQIIRKIGEDLNSLVDEQGKKKILLTFRNVIYFSSACNGKIIALQKKITAAHGKLVLCDITDDVREVFEITRIDKNFIIRNDEQSGLEALA